jgi:hypothetical protein
MLLLVDGCEEGVLAREVTVEQGPGDTGLFGDFLHQHIGVGVGGEEPCADGEELGAAVGGAESSARRHEAELS